MPLEVGESADTYQAASHMGDHIIYDRNTSIFNSRIDQLDLHCLDNSGFLFGSYIFIIEKGKSLFIYNYIIAFYVDRHCQWTNSQN